MLIVGRDVNAGARQICNLLSRPRNYRRVNGARRHTNAAPSLWNFTMCGRFCVTERDFPKRAPSGKLITKKRRGNWLQLGDFTNRARGRLFVDVSSLYAQNGGRPPYLQAVCFCAAEVRKIQHFVRRIEENRAACKN